MGCRSGYSVPMDCRKRNKNNSSPETVPNDLFLLPIFVAVNFLMAIIRLYALVTIREQKWIRENGSNEVSHSRTRQRIYHKTKDMILTTEIISVLVILVVFILQ